MPPKKALHFQINQLFAACVLARNIAWHQTVQLTESYALSGLRLGIDLTQGDAPRYCLRPFQGKMHLSAKRKAYAIRPYDGYLTEGVCDTPLRWLSNSCIIFKTLHAMFLQLFTISSLLNRFFIAFRMIGILTIRNLQFPTKQYLTIKVPTDCLGTDLVR